MPKTAKILQQNMKLSAPIVLHPAVLLASAHATTLILGDTSGTPRGDQAIDIQSFRSTANEVASGAHSVAMGKQVEVSGSDSVGVGIGNYIRGFNSAGFGSFNHIDGEYSVAIGYNNNSGTGTDVTLLGQENTASGTGYTLGLGYGNVTGPESVSVGFCNNVSGLGYAFGYDNIVSGGSISTPPYGYYEPSAAFGASNEITVEAHNSAIFGLGNYISARDASVYGIGISNPIAGSTMIGPSNTAKVTILSSGNVGIGNTNPAQKLTVAGAVRIINSANSSRYTDLYVDASGYLTMGNTVISGAMGASNGYYTFLNFGPLVSTAAGYFFSNNTNATSGSQDTGLYRLGAGKIGVGNATVGNASGTFVAGKIGVGIDTPSAALDVGGDIKATGGFIFKGPQAGATPKPLRITNWYDMESLVIQSETATNFADYKISFRNSANGNTTLSYGRGGVTLDSSISSFEVSGSTNQTADLFRVGGNFLKVAASGNVGIGTTAAPQAPLVIQFPIGSFNSPLNAMSFESRGSTGITGTVDLAIKVPYAYQNGVNQNATQPQLDLIKAKAGNTIFATDNTTNAPLGNVGIGTATPTERLDVSGNAKISGTLSVGGSFVLTAAGGSGANLTGLNATNISSGSLSVSRLPVEAAQLNAVQTLTNKTLSSAILNGTTTLGGVTTAQQVIVSSAGNLGVGVSPSHKLHVSGGTLAVDSGGGTDILKIRDGNITKTAGSGFTFDSSLLVAGGSSSNPAYTFSADSNTGIYTTSADTLGFSTAGSSRMIIDPTGNVGIGAATPAAKLDVNGGIQVAGNIIVKNVGPTKSVIRISPAGDIGMGDFVSGLNPNP